MLGKELLNVINKLIQVFMFLSLQKNIKMGLINFCNISHGMLFKVLLCRTDRVGKIILYFMKVAH